MALSGAIHRLKVLGLLGFRVADTGDGTQGWVLRERRASTTGEPCERAARAKDEVFAITVNGTNTIGVVSVDLERGVPVWNFITGLEKHYGR